MNQRDHIISNLDVESHTETEYSSQGASETTSLNEKRVMSIVEKLNAVTVNSDGSVTHLVFKTKDGSPRKFKDEETHKKWVAKHLRERREDLKKKLSPV